MYFTPLNIVFHNKNSISNKIAAKYKVNKLLRVQPIRNELLSPEVLFTTEYCSSPQLPSLGFVILDKVVRACGRTAKTLREKVEKSVFYLVICTIKPFSRFN